MYPRITFSWLYHQVGLELKILMSQPQYWDCRCELPCLALFLDHHTVEVCCICSYRTPHALSLASGIFYFILFYFGLWLGLQFPCCLFILGFTAVSRAFTEGLFFLLSFCFVLFCFMPRNIPGSFLWKRVILNHSQGTRDGCCYCIGSCVWPFIMEKGRDEDKIQHHSDASFAPKTIGFWLNPVSLLFLLCDKKC